MYEIADIGYRVFQGTDCERYSALLGRLNGAVQPDKWYFELCTFTGASLYSKSYGSPEEAEAGARAMAAPKPAASDEYYYD